MDTQPAAAAPAHRVQTLADLNASQVAAIRRIPAHDAAVFPAIEARRPASMFTDPAQFEREQALLFRRLPVPVMLSRMLPEPGSMIAHDGYGVPVLLMRDRDGVVRAFLNACQHKGARLFDHCEPVKGGRITCPYHAWTFALDGQLIGVARSETFDRLDKAARNLAALPCREAGGIIWVILDRHAAPDFSLIDAQLVADMDALELGAAHVYGHRSFELEANWKLVLEPFLEGYHVQRLHARSVGPLFADVPTVTERLGDHLRQTSGKTSFTPDLLDIPGENIHKSVTHAYQIFPCTVVITSPYYISVMLIMPRAVNRSTVDYYMLTLNPADTERARELYARSYETVLGVFGNEDFKAAEWCQKGLQSGALDEVVYCGLEAAIPMHYATLDKRLGTPIARG